MRILTLALAMYWQAHHHAAARPAYVLTITTYDPTTDTTTEREI